jgi:type IX secretion system PorP/SprF family membrane protein
MMLNKTNFFSRGRMGFGALFIQDKDGPLNSSFAELSYAYFLPLNHYYSELSFGLSAQFSSYNISGKLIHADDIEDPELNKLGNNRIITDGGCGIYYHDPQFYAGVSVNDLFVSKSPYNENNAVPNKRDYFFLTGYKFFLKHFDLEPSIYFAQVDKRPFYYYSQLKFYYLNYNWLAFGYKSTKSMLISLGLNLSRFYFAYVYEQNLSYLGSYFSGSHEIMIGINIGIYEPQGLIKRVGKGW